ncbi:MAG: ANL family adenylate-forming protein, partial [Candidatus Binataceae bacterium]
AKDPLTAALALIELDGIARRMVLCPTGVSPEDVRSAVATARSDAIVTDQASDEIFVPAGGYFVDCRPTLVPAACNRTASCETEWILLTSGSTGFPKLLQHTLVTLAGAIVTTGRSEASVVWSTFYDIRRYGGLQILLRALLGGGSLVLSSAQESTADFLIRVGTRGVTHISGTPSHWRRALMSPAAPRIAPRYIRLSGEIADQAILDSLRAFYPQAEVAHAFASTEAGVAFAVRDGLAGFPANLIGRRHGEVEMKIVDGSLRVRSARNALRYLGPTAHPLAGADGFVDTGDMVELRKDRYYFVGRRDGTINVGGLKVHPEEVEAVINQLPSVKMSLVKARKNSITGALVVADVVLQPELERSDASVSRDHLKQDILAACRQYLAPHKVPAVIRLVPSLAVTESGKLARLDA